MHWRPDAAWRAVRARTQPSSVPVTAGAQVKPGCAQAGSSGRASATTRSSAAPRATFPVTTGTLPAALLVVNSQGWPSTATNGSAASAARRGAAPSANSLGPGIGRPGSAGPAPATGGSSIDPSAQPDITMGPITIATSPNAADMTRDQGDCMPGA
jgi:hypothetical protein